jgi:hypothetical protein
MMNVVHFPRVPEKLPDGWQSRELQTLVNKCAGSIRTSETSWDLGMTEHGDPQLYLVGPAPDHDCILSISRLGRLYVLEDGKGRVIFETDDLVCLAEQACTALNRQKQAIIAQMAILWCGIREFLEEKVEPVLTEPVEVLSHFAPPLAGLV